MVCLFRYISLIVHDGNMASILLNKGAVLDRNFPRKQLIVCMQNDKQQNLRK